MVATAVVLSSCSSAHSGKHDVAAKSSSNLTETEEREILRELDPATSTTAALRFSWWVHGGEPGPDYVSEALDLTRTRQGIQAVYVRAVFDFKRTPHQATERFAGTLTQAQLASTLGSVLRSKLFSRTLPEERDPSVADNLRETFQLGHASRELEKTLFEPFPEGLEEIRALCRSLIEELKQKGARTLE
jgi:hypothetical protein